MVNQQYTLYLYLPTAGRNIEVGRSKDFEAKSPSATAFVKT